MKFPAFTEEEETGAGLWSDRRWQAVADAGFCYLIWAWRGVWPYCWLQNLRLETNDVFFLARCWVETCLVWDFSPSRGITHTHPPSPHCFGARKHDNNAQPLLWGMFLRTLRTCWVALSRNSGCALHLDDLQAAHESHDLPTNQRLLTSHAKPAPSSLLLIWDPPRDFVRRGHRWVIGSCPLGTATAVTFFIDGEVADVGRKWYIDVMYMTGNSVVTACISLGLQRKGMWWMTDWYGTISGTGGQVLGQTSCGMEYRLWAFFYVLACLQRLTHQTLWGSHLSTLWCLGIYYHVWGFFNIYFFCLVSLSHESLYLATWDRMFRTVGIIYIYSLLIFWLRICWAVVRCLPPWLALQLGIFAS